MGHNKAESTKQLAQHITSTRSYRYAMIAPALRGFVPFRQKDLSVGSFAGGAFLRGGVGGLAMDVA